MIVVFCDDAHTFGGAQIGLGRAIRAMCSRADLTIHLITNSGRLWKLIEDLGAVKRHAGPRARPLNCLFHSVDFPGYVKAGWILAEISPDYVIVNQSGVEFGLSFVSAAKSLGIPYSMWLHNAARFSVICGDLPGWKLCLAVFRDFVADGYLLRDESIYDCVSESSRMELTERGVELDRVGVISNCIDELDYCFSSRLIGLTNIGVLDTVRLCVIGRIEFSTKGQDVLMRALSLLNRGERRYSLRVIGDGCDAEKFKSLTVSLGECANVEMVGWSEAVGDSLKSIDMVVVPSLIESFGFVALECACMGVPVIASDVGDHSLILPKDFIFSAGCVESLISAIVLARFSSMELKSLALRNRARYSSSNFRRKLDSRMSSRLNPRVV
jgi:glycosyltransferase involved in cell wall biosynthesis